MLVDFGFFVEKAFAPDENRLVENNVLFATVLFVTAIVIQRFQFFDARNAFFTLMVAVCVLSEHVLQVRSKIIILLSPFS